MTDLSPLPSVDYVQTVNDETPVAARPLISSGLALVGSVFVALVLTLASASETNCQVNPGRATTWTTRVGGTTTPGLRASLLP